MFTPISWLPIEFGTVSLWKIIYLYFTKSDITKGFFRQYLNRSTHALIFMPSMILHEN